MPAEAGKKKEPEAVLLCVAENEVEFAALTAALAEAGILCQRGSRTFFDLYWGTFGLGGARAVPSANLAIMVPCHQAERAAEIVSALRAAARERDAGQE